MGWFNHQLDYLDVCFSNKNICFFSTKPPTIHPSKGGVPYHPPLPSTRGAAVVALETQRIAEVTHADPRRANGEVKVGHRAPPRVFVGRIKLS